jgi:hypothetical protein
MRVLLVFTRRRTTECEPRRASRALSHTTVPSEWEDGEGAVRISTSHGDGRSRRHGPVWSICRSDSGNNPRVGAIQLRRLLEAAGRKSKRNRYHRRFANNLLKVWPAPWTFATHPEVEPTNNPAEPALRGPVIHRELSHGTRSDDGERFAERVLSAAATCRQQQRSLFEFLTDLLTAHTRSDPLPALT